MQITLPKTWAGFHWENSYSKLPAILHQRQDPTPVRDPKLVLVNERLAAELGIDDKALASPEGVALLAGNAGIEGTTPLAQAYSGHQFGHFTTLGDGRAILLGEHCTVIGRRFDVQWKGPGRTVYSRGGDGRLALGPALREFLMSEAMAGLGIPTTRSLAVVTTGEPVFREETLPGAVLLRVASSHLRVGTFQHALTTQDIEVLGALVEYAIDRHYPGCDVAGFFEQAIERHVTLVSRWLSVGFIHGVMNTDNTTISGETIDFGPCAFLDTYDPATVFSSIDRNGRYAYGQQPGIIGWNLARLGDTLIPFLGKNLEEGEKKANEIMGTFADRFGAAFAKVFGAKLGLAKPRTEDVALAQELLQIAHKERSDFHGLWLALASDALPPAFSEWKTKWEARLHEEGTSTADAKARMRKTNPIVIPRNHRVEEALGAAQDGDFAPFHRLLAALRSPFVDTAEARAIAAPPMQADPSYRTFCGT